MTLQEMQIKQKDALNKADAIITGCESESRGMTAAENENYTSAMSEVQSLNPLIAHRKAQNSILQMLGENGTPSWLTGGGTPNQIGFNPTVTTANGMAKLATSRDPEYAKSLVSFLRTGGKAHGDELVIGADGQGGYHVPGSERFTGQRQANGRPSAATYEGTNGSSNGAGGYAVSIPTVQQIIPLAMPDLGLFDASMVIPTSTNIRIPQQASFGTSAAKAESTGTIATFGGSDPTIGQVELQAYMAGALRLVSWELLQDVEVWNQFVVDDLIKGQRILEGQLIATGTGSGQPQGVFGNTGTGTGAAYALAGTTADGATLLNSLFDVVATLRGAYQANASWVMTRATGLAIRRAQMQANLYIPVVTVDADGTERILGKPVFYDVNAPALPSATTAGVSPILYGDFKAGNIIGVRGGDGINVKVLDQPWAAQGQLGILAYRRLDSRVRRSEAIQAITFSHS